RRCELALHHRRAELVSDPREQGGVSVAGEEVITASREGAKAPRRVRHFASLRLGPRATISARTRRTTQLPCSSCEAAMANLITNLLARCTIALVGVFGACAAWAITAIAIQSRLARVARLELELKRQMLDKGLPATEIERVLRISPEAIAEES